MLRIADIHAAVFDMDGLLLDTELMARTTWSEAARSLGLNLTDELFRTLIGRNNRDGDRLLAQAFGPTFKAPVFHAACARCTEDYIQRYGLAVKPGAAELLEWLAEQSIPIGLATSSDRKDAEALLARAGLLRYFRVLVTGEQVCKGKPDPEIYLTAARGLRVEPPRCLALEDSHSGVRSARAAGMQVVMVPDLVPPSEEIRALASGIFDSLTEVLALLQRERETGADRSLSKLVPTGVQAQRKSEKDSDQE